MIGSQPPRLPAQTLGFRLLYGSLARALFRPDANLVRLFRRSQARRGVLDACGLLEDLQGLESPDWDNLTVSCRAWADSFARLTLKSMRASYDRLFGHTVRGPVSPYETEYGNQALFQQPQQLASLQGLYRIFGLRVRPQEKERADHISCQLEFMEFLYHKYESAWNREDREMAEQTWWAGRVFLKEHLGRFGRAFSRQLQDHDPEGFYGKAGGLLFQLLTVDCRSRGLAPGPEVLRLVAPAEDRVPMACGSDPDLVPLES